MSENCYRNCYRTGIAGQKTWLLTDDLGAYTPFFRAHAHHDSKRREPWMFGEETMVRLRKAVIARYALLPYWYTVFREAGITGMPVMR